MEADKSLVSGSMALLVLKLLEDGDKYGYQMTSELRQRSEDVFHLKAGTLYPLLHSLEEKGLVTAYEQPFRSLVVSSISFRQSCTPMRSTVP